MIRFGRPDPIVIVDIIGDIVSRVSAVILADLQTVDPNIENINYQFGPPLEIYETIAEMSQSEQGKKYPLVALFQPFNQKKGVATGMDSKVPLRLIIARWKNKGTLKAADAYETNFKPILYPVYAEFMYQLSIHGAIADTTWQKIPHGYKDWPYWDNDGKNPLIDEVDIIEISNLELNFKYNNCLNTTLVTPGP